MSNTPSVGRPVGIIRHVRPYLRWLLFINLALACVYAITFVFLSWANPGRWSGSRVAAELVGALDVDRVELEPGPPGTRHGAAFRDGSLVFEIVVHQSPGTMEYEATASDGKRRGGKRNVTTAEWSWDAVVFPVFMNLAFLMVFAGMRLTASFSSVGIRDIVGYLGVVPAGVALWIFSGLPAGYRLGDLAVSDLDHLRGWFGGASMSLAIGMLARHFRRWPGGGSQSSSERRAEKRGRGPVTHD